NSGATCRTFATKSTAIDDGTPSATGLTVTGSFNSSTRQFTATTTFPGDSSICTTVVFNYSSIADFVDEMSVVPGRALTTQTMSSSCAGAAATSTRTYTYDGQRRVTQVVQDGQTTTYTAWDSAGRPTAGVISGGPSLSDVFDDASRTDVSTSINKGVTTIARLTYDANVILLSEVHLTGPPHTITWTINSTGTVCK